MERSIPRESPNTGTDIFNVTWLDKFVSARLISTQFFNYTFLLFYQGFTIRFSIGKRIYIVTPGGDRPRHCRRISYTFIPQKLFIIYVAQQVRLHKSKPCHDSRFKYCRSLTKRPADQYIDFRGSIFSRCTNFMSA